MHLQAALRLPLIETILAAGGSARPGEIYDALAEKLSINRQDQEKNVEYAEGKHYNRFQQQVRWARQTAVLDGLISSDTRGIWEITKAGRKFAELTKIKRGHVVLIYRADDGVALCAHAEDAASLIAKGSLNLILSSPPYPVVNRSYGRYGVTEWLKWMDDLMGIWRQLIRPDGTIAINLMDVHQAGSPNLDAYVERFTLNAIDQHDLHLAGRMPWVSPTKLGHIEWTSKRKLRPRNVLEHIILLSPSQNPTWDATRLPPRPLRERSESQTRSDLLRQGKTTRPSGLDINHSAFAGQVGISDNLFIAGGASGSDTYSRSCRANNETPHPARFPREVPKRVILLTTDVGDTVYDPMAGSNTTGEVAHALGRRWISSDPVLDFVQSSRHRFDQSITT